MELCAAKVWRLTWRAWTALGTAGLPVSCQSRLAARHWLAAPATAPAFAEFFEFWSGRIVVMHWLPGPLCGNAASDDEIAVAQLTETLLAVLADIPRPIDEDAAGDAESEHDGGSEADAEQEESYFSHAGVIGRNGSRLWRPCTTRRAGVDSSVGRRSRATAKLQTSVMSRGSGRVLAPRSGTSSADAEHVLTRSPGMCVLAPVGFDFPSHLVFGSVQYRARWLPMLGELRVGAGVRF